MVDSVQAAVDVDTPFLEMFLCLFGTTLASFLGLLVTAFFFFHIWLMTRAMTTIDFCEKSMKRSTYDNVLYDLGLWGNIKAVLGPHVFLFLLPVSTPAGDGLSYMSEATRLTAHPEQARVKSWRKKGKKGEHAPNEQGVEEGFGQHHGQSGDATAHSTPSDSITDPKGH